MILLLSLFIQRTEFCIMEDNLANKYFCKILTFVHLLQRLDQILTIIILLGCIYDIINYLFYFHYSAILPLIFINLKSATLLTFSSSSSFLTNCQIAQKRLILKPTYGK